jgi:uncharacterized membrane protein YfcA
VETVTLLLILAAFAFLSALAQGVTGFGFSLLLIGLLTAVTVPVVESTFFANILCVFVQITVIVRLRQRFPWRHVWTMVAAAAVALPIGVWLLHEFGRQDWIGRVLGGVITAIALWLLVAPQKPTVHRKPDRWLGVLAGGASGLVGGMFNTGGPPAVLYVYSRPIALDVAKVCVQWLFTAMSIARLAMAAPAGMISWQVTWMSALVGPLVILGGVVGVKLAGRFHPELIRRLVFALLLAIGVKLLVF